MRKKSGSGTTLDPFLGLRNTGRIASANGPITFDRVSRMNDHDRANDASQSRQGDQENAPQTTDPSTADHGDRDDSSATPEPTETPTANQGRDDASGGTRRQTQEPSGDQDGGGGLPTPTRVSSATGATTRGKWLASLLKPVVVAVIPSAIIFVATVWVVSVFWPEIDPADRIGLALVVLSLIWSASVFFLQRAASEEQQRRDHAFQVAREEREAVRARRREERETAREHRREAREEAREKRKVAREHEREVRKERRAKERARGEIAATIATHVVDINALLAKIDVLAKPLLDDGEVPDNFGFVIRCPQEIQEIVRIDYR